MLQGTQGACSGAGSSPENSRKVDNDALNSADAEKHYDKDVSDGSNPSYEPPTQTYSNIEKVKDNGTVKSNTTVFGHGSDLTSEPLFSINEDLNKKHNSHLKPEDSI